MAIEISLGFLLHDAARLWGKRFDQIARDLSLSRAQAKAICYLMRNEGINQSGLAELLEIEPISLARQLDKLEAGGWVERRADPSDRRTRRLHPTGKARALYAQVRSLASEVEDIALGDFSPEEKGRLLSYMERVHQNLCEREGPCALPLCSPVNGDPDS